MRLYGRGDLLRQISASSSGVVLLVGDSGTGKSSLLRQVQLDSKDALAPMPVRVNSAPGSLQLALLEALGLAVAQLAVDESGAERVARVLTQAARRVGEGRLNDLRSAIGHQLLGIVRSKVSDEFADLVGQFADSIVVAQNESLQARISAASDRDVVNEILSLAEEVRSFGQVQVLYLGLDDVDRLGQDDLSRLADLPERLSDGVRVRASFTTSSVSSRVRADELLIRGASTVDVAGLAVDAVREWLEEVGLPGGLAPAVMKATNGYPVHVEDAIALLRSDPRIETLRSMAPDDVLQARAKQSWRELDNAARYAIAKLSAYVDPLPVSRVCALLNVDELAWGTVRSTLVDAGFLIDGPTTWFHELRRRAIWNDLLDNDMRLAAVDAATAELTSQLELSSWDVQVAIDFARIAAQNTALRHQVPSVAAAFRLSKDELAVAAAALELAEPSDVAGAVGSVPLLTFARSMYGLRGDAIAALDGLASAGLLHVASNDHSAVVVPTWSSIEAVQVLVGRAATELDRVPTIRLATAVFETVLRPQLTGFDMAEFGVGSPAIAELSRRVQEMHRRPKDGIVHVGRSGPGIAIRASHGGVRVYAAVAFQTEEDCSAAATSLAGIEMDLWDQPFAMHEVIQLPCDVVPSLRFAVAVNWLDGRSADLHTRRPPELGRALTIEDELNTRLQIRTIVNERSSMLERLAYRLGAQTGYAYAADGDATTIIDVEGWDSVSDWSGRLVTGIGWSDPYELLRCHEELNLQLGEEIRRKSWRSGPPTKDPLWDELFELQGNAAGFNYSQRRLALDVDEARIRGLLEAAFARRRADGIAILEALDDPKLSEPAPTVTCVLLDVREDQGGWVSGPGATAYSCTVPCDTDEAGVRFRMKISKAGQADQRPSGPELMSMFGVSESDRFSSGVGTGDSVIAGLLGHHPDELRLDVHSVFR